MIRGLVDAAVAQFPKFNTAVAALQRHPTANVPFQARAKAVAKALDVHDRLPIPMGVAMAVNLYTQEVGNDEKGGLKKTAAAHSPSLAPQGLRCHQCGPARDEP